MKKIFSERNIVVILFIIVIITFSFAQNDSKKIERGYAGTAISVASRLIAQQQLVKTSLPFAEKTERR